MKHISELKSTSFTNFRDECINFFIPSFIFVDFLTLTTCYTMELGNTDLTTFKVTPGIIDRGKKFWAADNRNDKIHNKNDFNVMQNYESQKEI